jgi:hypothetical protein
MRYSRLAFLSVAAVFFLGGQAFAQFPVDITVDENGNGTILWGGVLSSLPSWMAPDPGPGGLPSALTYGLPVDPPAPVVGDVLLSETGGGYSDVIRFNGTASLVFYSDIDDPVLSLADTGLPSALYPQQVIIPEVGPEGANGADYTPGPNDPGFIPTINVTYHFQSDVPEPSSIVLLGIGAVSLLAYAWRQRRKAV